MRSKGDAAGQPADGVANSLALKIVILRVRSAVPILGLGRC